MRLGVMPVRLEMLFQLPGVELTLVARSMRMSTIALAGRQSPPAAKAKTSTPLTFMMPISSLRNLDSCLELSLSTARPGDTQFREKQAVRQGELAPRKP